MNQQQTHIPFYMELQNIATEPFFNKKILNPTPAEVLLVSCLLPQKEIKSL